AAPPPHVVARASQARRSGPDLRGWEIRRLPELLRAQPGGRLRADPAVPALRCRVDRKSTRLNSSHLVISYAVFCLKKKNPTRTPLSLRPARKSLSPILPSYAIPLPSTDSWPNRLIMSLLVASATSPVPLATTPVPR